MHDDQIIKLFFTRNEDAILQTAYKYGTRLLSLAKNTLQSMEDAEESVNDTYLYDGDGYALNDYELNDQGKFCYIPF